MTQPKRRPLAEGPLGRGQMEPGEARPRLAPDPSVSASQPGPGTILVVDDDEPVRELVSAVLATAGYRTQCAHTGAEGLQLAQKGGIDLILLDVMMPETDGRTVARVLKSSPKTREIPIIMLTGLISLKDKLKGLDAGADEYLTKPIHGTELLARVRAMLRLSALHEDLVQAERERQEAKLLFAREVQQSLLPEAAPQMTGIDLAVRYQPCDAVGGDLYDFGTYGPNRLCFALGDGEGHGLSAALLMARAGAYVRSSLRSGNLSPASLLNDVNQMLCQDHLPAVLLPMLCVFVDTRERVLRYANAGHSCPLLYRSEAEQVIPLESTGPMLGMADDEYYEEERTPIAPGDTLICFTDGLTDAIDRDRETLDGSYWGTVIQCHARESAEGLADTLISAWSAHCAGNQQDDMTLLVMKLLDR